MNYKEKVDKLVGHLLKSEEKGIDCQLVLDSELAYDVAKELLYKFDKPFVIEEEDEFEKDLKENDILGVALSVYKDGEIMYFLQPVMTDEGETYEDEITEILYIQDDLLDCVDIYQFVKADIFIIKEDSIEELKCNCRNCDEEYLEFAEEMDDYVDEKIADIHCYFVDKLIENEDNVEFDFSDLMDDILRIAFMEGFGKALDLDEE